MITFGTTLNIVAAGKIASNPEMKYTSSGTPFIKFSLPWTISRKQDDKYVKHTCWLNVAVWGKGAEILNGRIEKGSTVSCDLRMEFDVQTGGPRIYETNGEPRSRFEFSANSVSIISGVKIDDAVTVQGEESEAEEGSNASDDDIPF